jgi:probable HAF family extracellular repeat protein
MTPRFGSTTLLSIALACTFAQAQTIRDEEDLSSPTTLRMSRPSGHIRAAQRANAGSDAVSPDIAQTKAITYTTVDYPGASYSIVLDTNASTAVGAMAFDGVTYQPLTIKGTKYATFAVPGSTGSWATGINTAGQICGVYFDGSGNVHGFSKSGNSYTTLDYPGAIGGTYAEGMNDSSQIVGLYSDGTVESGFLYKSGTMTNISFPGSVWTLAFGINSSGDIVGRWRDASNAWHGFLLKGGTFTSMDFPQSTYTGAWGINDSGVIVGVYRDAAGVQHGFRYSNGTYSTEDVVGASQSGLYRMKNNGTVVGEYTDVFSEVHGIKGK